MQFITVTAPKSNRGRPPNKAKKAKQAGQKIESSDLEKGGENNSNSNNAFQKNKPIIVSFP